MTQCNNSTSYSSTFLFYFFSITFMAYDILYIYLLLNRQKYTFLRAEILPVLLTILHLVPGTVQTHSKTQ